MSKKVYISLCAILTLLSWCFQYFFSANQNAYFVITCVELCVYGLVICLEFSLLNDSFYPLVLIGFVPFIFALGFDPNHLPFAMYIAIGLALIGATIHFIRFKPKLKLGKLFPGLAIFAFSLLVGGIFNKNNTNLLWQIAFCLLMAATFLIFYTFLVSTNKTKDFDSLSFYMNIFALMIIGQAIIYYSTKEGFRVFDGKSMELGWGCTNNFALMLLLFGPFSLYKGLFGKRKYDYLYIILKFAESFFILTSYSRGCIFIDVASLGTLLIVSAIIKRNNWWKVAMPTIISITLEIIVLLIIDKVSFTDYSLFSKMKDTIVGGVHLDSMNGRTPIYSTFIKKSFEYPIFGQGVLYPLMIDVGLGEGVYQWGHCTLIHTLFTTGLFGLLAILYHLFEKYYSCIKDINPEKFTLLLAFLLSGAYGMIDISYFYPNYMIVLVMIFVLSDSLISGFIVKKD